MKEGKRYFAISEVADMLGVEASTLRYWEKEFPLLSPKRNDKGKRFYTEEDVANVRLVYYLLKEKNLTIKGAKKVLEEDKNQVERTYEVVKRLEALKKEIGQLKSEFGVLLKRTISIEEL